MSEMPITPKVPTDSPYAIDAEKFGKTIDTLKAENQTEVRLNGYITCVLRGWRMMGIQDIALWNDFRDEFNGWTPETFKVPNKTALKLLRMHLTTHGAAQVEVKTMRGDTGDHLNVPPKWDRSQTPEVRDPIRENTEDHTKNNPDDFNFECEHGEYRGNSPEPLWSKMLENVVKQHIHCKDDPAEELQQNPPSDSTDYVSPESDPTSSEYQKSSSPIESSTAPARRVPTRSQGNCTQLDLKDRMGSPDSSGSESDPAAPAQDPAAAAIRAEFRELRRLYTFCQWKANEDVRHINMSMPPIPIPEDGATNARKRRAIW
ncbi:uncharacterized protein N7515_008324 [Penicillium bovifimosum]|uniref:Uncharacterized protein n=1 Tax=Penicillium bovifimosum TaxID=126998 RepID=A0A9W9GN75_9EURO|nr:uncharacterized protein N7515_008324 [Penicillium bovifimosum]KAJ5124499.1 hypothetical protein N7515_008324 [Penicillium bovifimosum]